MNIQSAVIDNGYYSTIIYQHSIPSKIYSFRSKYQSINSLMSYHHTHHLIYDNQSYLIGEGAEQIDINLNKTNSTLHFLTTLTALGLLADQLTNFNLIANIPLNLYNKVNKEQLENRLTIIDPLQFILNNKHKTISISKCTIFPQCLPVLYVNNTKSSIIGIIDIGGLTVQGCITENKNMIDSSKFTENLGILILQNKIKQALNQEYNINIQDYEMENIIKYGLSSDKENSLSIIDSICISHLEKIITILKLAGWNFENLQIVCTGGGSLMLEKYLHKFLPYYSISKNPVNDNVYGLWEVAKYVYNI